MLPDAAFAAAAAGTSASYTDLLLCIGDHRMQDQMMVIVTMPLVRTSAAAHVLSEAAAVVLSSSPLLRLSFCTRSDQ